MPEPERFILEDIAERWSDLDKKKITVGYLHRLNEIGQLEIETDIACDYGDSGPLDMFKTIGERLANAKYIYSYYITKDERDRFEREYLAGGLESEPGAREKNAYLRLIGYMALKLKSLDKLPIQVKYKAAAAIVKDAQNLGYNIGKEQAIGQKIEAALEALEKSRN